MSKIKVIAGDLLEGKWDFSSPVMWINSGTWVSPKTERVSLKNLMESVEAVTEENKKKFFGTVGWGLVGTDLLGPLGFIGGALVGGNKKEVCFACLLTDGRKFMAVTDGKTWKELMVLSFNKK